MDERRVPTAPEAPDSAGESPCDRSPQSGDPTPPPGSASPLPKAASTSFVTVTHRILFADEGPRCDVCGDRLFNDDEDPDTALTGSGLYIWSHGGQIVYEEPPLCASCGTAIGMSALARWEIEEEEG
jgi:hypothetical protein